jgi:hypothetical protein
LLPVPILDGGHLVFYLFEALRGKPVPENAQEYGYRIGFGLILCLMVFATWNDVIVAAWRQARMDFNQIVYHSHFPRDDFATQGAFVNAF